MPRDQAGSMNHPIIKLDWWSRPSRLPDCFKKPDAKAGVAMMKHVRPTSRAPGRERKETGVVMMKHGERPEVTADLTPPLEPSPWLRS
jgi:hypothetical protein